MTESSTARTRIRIDLASELVAAYVSKNAVRVAELPGLLASLGETLDQIAKGRANESPWGYPHALDGAHTSVGPADIERSVTSEALVSFIDGKPYKTLKHHLAKHGLASGGYRIRFGLPADYPMVSPSYSERRVAIAKSLGLGQVSGKGRKSPR